MAMAISYNWLFLWDDTFYKWGDLLVLITDSHGHTRWGPLDSVQLVYNSNNYGLWYL